jgi:hypothetical protein
MGNRQLTKALTDAGEALMARRGLPMTRRPHTGKEKVYTLPTGETVRLRTSAVRRLVTRADRPAIQDARLTIQGTDKLLLVTLAVADKPGPVVAYLVPMKAAVDEMKRQHGAWLKAGGHTAGENMTPVLSLDAADWAEFRLDSDLRVAPDWTLVGAAPVGGAGRGDSVKAVVDEARERIAAAAGVPPRAVRITIDYAVD